MPRGLVGIRLEWVGETPHELALHYRALARDYEDYRPLWELIIKHAIQPMIYRHFADEGVDGKKYKQLSRYTIAQKATLGYPIIPLIRTRRWMRNASSRMIWAATKLDTYAAMQSEISKECRKSIELRCFAAKS